MRDLDRPDDDQDVQVIRNPERIEQILTLLKSTEGSWGRFPQTPPAGRYSLGFSGEGVRLFARVGNGVLQVQGSDYSPHYREISETEEQQLVSLFLVDERTNLDGSRESGSTADIAEKPALDLEIPPK